MVDSRDARLQEVMEQVDALLGKLVLTATQMSAILKEEVKKEDGRDRT